MVIVLVHWQIRPDETSRRSFIEHWNSHDIVVDRTGLIAEFLNEAQTASQIPFITWDLDVSQAGDCISYVTVGLWADSGSYKQQIESYFNESEPPLQFEKYRRRRIVLKPVQWRIGATKLPAIDSPNTK